MVTRSKGRDVLGLVAGLGLVASTFAFAILPNEPTAFAAGAPAGLTQGFSEIVKKVTPAVVNIAVTGGGKARGEVGNRRCRQAHLADLLVKKGQRANFQLLRRCLRVEGTDVPIKAQDPALFLTRTDLSSPTITSSKAPRRLPSR
mgnify:CR=1 FL=1